MIVLSILLPVVTCSILFSGSVTAQRYPDSLPIVDLGYELYRAADFNVRLELLFEILPKS